MYADSREYECVNTDVAQLDITNIEAVMKLAEEVKPYAIINCAAHTNVNACETDVDNAYKINAIGPRNLSIAATRYNAKLVHISTDYVFSGDSKEPYLEFDQTGPKGMHGKTKLAKTMLNLSQNHDTVRVVGDQIGSPTSATELAKAKTQLQPSDNYGLFHGTCEGYTSWAEFTKEIFRLAGKKTNVETITTEEYLADATGIVAPRPAYSILENYMLKLTTNHMFAQWEDAIAEYIKNLN